MNIDMNSIKAHDSIEHTVKIDFYVKNDDEVDLYKLGYTFDFYLLDIPIGHKSVYKTGTLNKKMSEHIEETLVLGHHIFNMIEKKRNKGDVSLRIDVGLLCLKPKEFDPKENISDATKFGHLPMLSEKQILHPISERKWIEMISKMGYMNYAIFEIPYSKIPSVSDFEDIINRLKDAEQLLYDGNNEDVVTRCRKAIETLNPLVTVDVKNGPMVSALASKVDIGCKGQQNKPNKSQRIESVRQNIWTLLHIGPHEGYTITREDAEYIYWLTLSTVRYYAVQFNK